MSISVLVCDDLPAVQGMLRRMLEREGLEVAGLASTADEVIALYRQRRPDIVLLDLRMPGASGLSVLRTLRLLDPMARVVMCSGTSDPAVQRAAMDAGAVDWVLKPVYTQTLVARLRELVARPRRAGRGAADPGSPVEEDAAEPDAS